MNITVSEKLKHICPTAKLLVFNYEVEVKKSSTELYDELEKITNDLQNQYDLSEIVEIPAIKNTREAYKKLGKSPSSYRNAAEAMLRRIIKGNGLYHINNIVDINNIVSISTGYSVGSYNCENLSGDLLWGPATKGESYKGIGKNSINIENLPTLYDNKGAFGNPTSDSNRAMIELGKHKVISVVYSFSGDKDFDNISNSYRQLLNTFTNAENLQITAY